MGGFGEQQPLAQTRVRHHEVVIDLKQGQLIPQARFALTQRIDPASDGRHSLADVEIEALDKGGIDGPAAGR